MTRAEYDAIDAEHFSTLKHILRSPAHYKHALTHPDEETAAMILGRVVHAMVLEPASLNIAVWEGERRGNAWKEFKIANAGKDILTEEENERARAMAFAVLNKPSALALFKEGRPEVTLAWEHRGVKLKGRLDWRGHTLWDLKTTRDASVDAFGREFAQRLYHMQAAMYLHGNEMGTGQKLPCYSIAVENEEPYDVIVYRVPPQALALGHQLYEKALDRLVACRKADSWPGIDNGIAEVELSLPSWAETAVFA